VSVNAPPERQRAFHFTASNCIGCHSCEAACSEKNGLPPHIAWRKVGYVETGTFPDYRRVHISMACNHCDDPVCLKGCPTRAYVKYADTGAVIQDPDVCFGCQYCTWVCPYGAPAYDPQAGTVSKCNMCVDRLAVGLQPACVAACLGHALDFDARDALPDRFGEALPMFPGFPDPAITRPNVRFRFDGDHGPAYTRPDDMNLGYAPPAAGAAPVRPQAARGGGRRPAPKPLRWGTLQSSESPLVAFTLIAQGVVGAFAAFLGMASGAASGADAGTASGALHGIGPGFLAALCALLAYGLFTSTMHLGRPRYFYRAMNNLRHSWVSREILCLGSFMGLLTAYTAAFSLDLLPPLPLAVLGGAAAVCGVLGVVSMVRIYRIPARPYWNHPHTDAAFAATALTLGPLALGAVLAARDLLAGTASGAPFSALVGTALAAALAGRVSAWRHGAWLARRGGEAEAALDLLAHEYARFRAARRVAAALLIGLLAAALVVPAPGARGALLLAALPVALAGEALERFLFYLVVIPTTMPGALFLKNRGFERLARETGLAEDRAVGVAPDVHGPGQGPPPLVPITRLPPPAPAPEPAPEPEPAALAVRR